MRVDVVGREVVVVVVSGIVVVVVVHIVELVVLLVYGSSFKRNQHVCGLMNIEVDRNSGCCW